VVDQRIRDTEYAKAMEYQGCDAQGQAPLDLTEPKLGAELTGADNVMAAETRSTGYHYRHYDKTTGEWERRWEAHPHPLPETHIHRDPQVKQEGNDVTQAAFQSPYAHLADRYYERLIFSRDQLSSLFGRREEGAERGPVQRVLLDRYKELTAREMFKLGMFVQRGMTVMPTGKEYEGVGNQKDFDSNANGIMIHADCYLVITTGKEGTWSTPASSLETQRSICNMGPLSAGSTTSKENTQHE
jgi:hypothetical protein